MKSAKFTGLTFLAAAALGAVAWIGCTTSTDTSDLGDGGGTVTPPPSTPTDGGTDDTDSGTQPEVCGSEYAFSGDGTLDPSAPDCQPCLLQKCCAPLKECFNAGIDAGADYSCNDHQACINNCFETSADDTAAQACIQEQCNAAAGDQIVTSHLALQGCIDQECPAECYPE